MLYRLFAAAAIFTMLLAAPAVAAQSTVDTVVGDIDAFWSEQFANAGLTYTSPHLVPIDGQMQTTCGGIDPYYSPGAYCAADQTVYYSTAWAPNDDSAEILWWTVLSHEWGHHIQWLVNTGVSTTYEAEQQADCFAGAYMRHAEEIGLVSPDAVSVGLSITQSAGDVWFLLPEDSPAHGNKSERALAFMTGMNGGVTACGFPG